LIIYARGGVKPDVQPPVFIPVYFLFESVYLTVLIIYARGGVKPDVQPPVFIPVYFLFESVYLTVLIIYARGGVNHSTQHVVHSSCKEAGMKNRASRIGKFAAPLPIALAASSGASNDVKTRGFAS
jgi:hypothetical protein